MQATEIQDKEMQVAENGALDGILPAVQQLNAHDKLLLIRILAQELLGGELLKPLEQERMIEIWTPYSSFGAARILSEELGKYSQDSTKRAATESEGHAIPILDPEFITG